MKIGYARVSTVGQDLHSQIMDLKKAGCDDVLYEKYTGTSTNHPVFDQVSKN
ncbi:recombinase family protein [Pediococcus claussenii]|uniref:Resolvase/invertase-type recombinase catalytic domain-containing protein n=1 Tax=Pediococcus claussenii (strain ATCC BAA-344 / DSM 14800 / JCM 18046 / KCTC 3811 / LMG 21948 / P06) TaxID=701521 RepID=G8PBA7_PEDCP|nr:recombinase family protein [Pediococcus claussenii]AEV95896.1 hypothetical protein PECL_1679 [Pediococcus claussenii ATCC BAA-344]